MTSSAPRRLLPRLAAVLLLLLTLAEVGARLVAPRIGLDVRPLADLLAEQSQQMDRLLTDTASLTMLDADLGWRHRPGFADSLRHYDAAGIRGTRVVSPLPTAGVTRLVAAGDAFTAQLEVGDDEAWPAVLETASPGTEVLNMGVGGYGTDQAMLHFVRDGAPFAPRLVLIGFASVDLRRAIGVFPRFASTYELPLTKPRFTLDAAGALAFVPNPAATRAEKERLRDDPASVRALGPLDGWYERWRYEAPLLDRSGLFRAVRALATKVHRRSIDADRLYDGEGFRAASPAFRLQLAQLLAFGDSVRARGAMPVYVLLPAVEAVERARRGGEPDFAPLREALRGDGRAPVLDVTEAFVAAAPPSAGVRAWFMSYGHYSASGNAVVGTWLAGQLAPYVAR